MGVAIVPTPLEMLTITDFPGHVAFLISWLEARMAWLDDYFNGRLYGYDPLVALVIYQESTNPVNIIIDGVRRNFSPPAIILQDRTMVSLFEAAAAFNAIAGYDPDFQFLTLTIENTIIGHQLGASFYFVNGVRHDFGTPLSLLIGDRVYIPLRMIASGFGYDIQWNDATRTVTVSRS